MEDALHTDTHYKHQLTPTPSLSVECMSHQLNSGQYLEHVLGSNAESRLVTTGPFQVRALTDHIVETSKKNLRELAQEMHL